VFTDEGYLGLGEVSDIANRMKPLITKKLSDIFKINAVGSELDYWPLISNNTEEALPRNIHPELRGLTLFGLEIGLLDLVGKKYSASLSELLGDQCRNLIEVC